MDRYEEALERAKKGLPIDEVFPELKESEDERIRKMLIEQMERWKKAAEDNNLDVKDASAAIAYLEKQKEQKPESCDCSRDEESYTNGIHHVLMNPEAYGLIKQKPAEWSEEDELMRTAVIQTLKMFGGRGTTEMQIDWLKSLPERFSLKPQQEWSEEDNNALVLFHELISFGYTERFCDAQTAEDMRRWLNERLKSTRPQPHWKPSKVQMKALNEVANDGVLLDLFNDLLKLL